MVLNAIRTAVNAFASAQLAAAGAYTAGDEIVVPEDRDRVAFYFSYDEDGSATDGAVTMKVEARPSKPKPLIQVWADDTDGGTAAVITVNGPPATTLTLTVTGGTGATLTLTDAANDTLAELVAVLSAVSDVTAVLLGDGSLNSKVLEAVSSVDCFNDGTDASAKAILVRHNWHQVSVHEAGTLSSGSDVGSFLQREEVKYKATGADEEYPILEVSNFTGSHVRLLAKESGDATNRGVFEAEAVLAGL